MHLHVFWLGNERSEKQALRRQVQRIIDRRLGVGTCVLPEVRTRVPDNGRGGVAAKGAARVDRYVHQAFKPLA